MAKAKGPKRRRELTVGTLIRLLQKLPSRMKVRIYTKTPYAWEHWGPVHFVAVDKDGEAVISYDGYWKRGDSRGTIFQDLRTPKAKAKAKVSHD